MRTSVRLGAVWLRAVSIKGSSYMVFQRSIDAGQATNAIAAAHELGKLHRLADSLALVLVLSLDPHPHYARYRDRWLLRLQQHIALDWEMRQTIDEALRRFPDPTYRPNALTTLEWAMESMGQRDCLEVIGRERRRRP